MKKSTHTKTIFLALNSLLVLGIAAVLFQHRPDEASSRREIPANTSHEFIRGDGNEDGSVDISDTVFILGYLFRAQGAPECLAASDANDDGKVDVSDAVWLLNYSFRGGNPPLPPFPDPGLDPTPDLGCRGSALPPLPAVGSYGGPDRELTDEEAILWRRGFDVFDRAFHVDRGLGPFHNGDSCRGCHLDPVVGGAGGLDVDVVRFAHVDNEGTVTQLPTGPAASRHEIDGYTHDSVHTDANVIETRQTPTLLGLGLVDRIPEANILANADPDDLDGDGISGRVRILRDGRLGKFGHKCGVPTMRDFAADAMLNELGITIHASKSIFAEDSDSDEAADPELSDDDFEGLAFYIAHLAPPPRELPTDQGELDRVEDGEAIFTQIGCADCHMPSLAGEHGEPVEAYSDFLLHNVANPSRSNVDETAVEPREFRTAPLWGLRDTAPYLHDGSATSIGDAVVDGHFGEAAAARQAYLDLTFDEEAKLLEFLKSL